MIETERYRAHGRAVVSAAWFLFAAGLWVTGCFLLFLATGWPRWAFYAAIVLGAVALVQLGGRRSGSEGSAAAAEAGTEPRADGPEANESGIPSTDGGHGPE